MVSGETEQGKIEGKCFDSFSFTANKETDRTITSVDNALCKKKGINITEESFVELSYEISSTGSAIEDKSEVLCGQENACIGITIASSDSGVSSILPSQLREMNNIEVFKDGRDQKGKNTGNVAEPVANTDKILYNVDRPTRSTGIVLGKNNSNNNNVLGNNMLRESSKMKDQVVKSGKTKTYREIDRVEDSLFVKLLDFLEELVEDGVFTNPIPYHPLELKDCLTEEIENYSGEYR